MKYAIVRSNRLNSFKDKLNTDSTCVMNMFDFSNVFYRIIVELCLKLHIPISTKLFNQELTNVDADTIIVFDGHARKEFLEWLKNSNPTKRLIYWCWNTVKEISENFDINTIPDGYEIWSYSKYDCDKYGLKYNTTFFWNSYFELSSKESKYDVFFVGKDKGRLGKIKAVADILDKENLKYRFNIVKTHFWNRNKDYSRKMSYDQVIEMITLTKAILDIKVDANAGPSLRALEAAFFRKKLITDDPYVKDFDFYCKNNVYILGEDNIPIQEFLSVPLKLVSDKEINKYSFLSWIERFV